jgi:hypothetical protein
MKLINPINGYERERNYGVGVLAAFLFGPLYLLACGAPAVGAAWLIGSILCSLGTGGFGAFIIVPIWWIYCFFAPLTVRNALLEGGYKIAPTVDQQPNQNNQPQNQSTRVGWLTSFWPMGTTCSS